MDPSAPRNTRAHSAVDPLAATQPMPAFGDTLRMERASLAEAFNASEQSWFSVEMFPDSDPDELAAEEVTRAGCVGTPYLIAFAAALVPLVLSFA